MNAEAASAESRRTRVRSLLSWAAVVVAAVAFSTLFKAFVGQAYAIPSGSMESTLEVGDRVLAERLSYAAAEGSAPGDIVTFADPADPSRTLIKRVVATEGQAVDLQDGRVLVDGRLLDEPYTEGKPTLPLAQGAAEGVTYPYVVPEGNVWVMGDNRTNSLDSRAFGSVPEGSVTGRACFRLWPLDRFGALE